MDNNESQLKKIIEKRIEAKSNYSLLFVALKVLDDALKKLEEVNDNNFVEMVSLLERALKITWSSGNKGSRMVSLWQ